MVRLKAKTSSFSSCTQPGCHWPSQRHVQQLPLLWFTSYRILNGHGWWLYRPWMLCNTVVLQCTIHITNHKNVQISSNIRSLLLVTITCFFITAVLWKLKKCWVNTHQTKKEQASCQGDQISEAIQCPVLVVVTSRRPIDQFFGEEFAHSSAENSIKFQHEGQDPRSDEIWFSITVLWNVWWCLISCQSKAMANNLAYTCRSFDGQSTQLGEVVVGSHLRQIEEPQCLQHLFGRLEAPIRILVKKVSSFAGGCCKSLWA